MNLKFEKRSIALDKLIHQQREPSEKKGIGYGSNQKNHETGGLNDKEGHQGDNFAFQDKSKSTTSSRRNQKSRYEKAFTGYCFSCNESGHKVIDCMPYASRSVRSPNNEFRCWRCNDIGYIVTHCHTMSCYKCNGFGHKYQDYWKSRRQPMRSTPYLGEKKHNDV